MYFFSLAVMSRLTILAKERNNIQSAAPAAAVSVCLLCHEESHL